MPLHIVSPLLHSQGLTNLLHRNIYVKMDAMQPSGSFKIRGIGYHCQQLYKQGKRHFISSSGGNAGMAVAYSGKMLKVPVTVYVPEATSKDLIAKIRDEGATVEIAGESWQEAHFAAQKLAEETGGGYVHPFDHPEIWHGHASLVDEWVAQNHQFDLIVLSVGGGGLLCGVVQGLMRHGLEKTPILAVETEGAASLNRSVKAGELVTLDRIDSIAVTLGAKKVTQQALEYAQNYPIHTHLVSDEEAVEACRLLAETHRVLVEPACGAALAGLQTYDLKPYKSILLIVCGGSNVSYRSFYP